MAGSNALSRMLERTQGKGEVARPLNRSLFSPGTERPESYSMGFAFAGHGEASFPEQEKRSFSSNQASHPVFVRTDESVLPPMPSQAVERIGLSSAGSETGDSGIVSKTSSRPAKKEPLKYKKHGTSHNSMIETSQDGQETAAGDSAKQPPPVIPPRMESISPGNGKPEKDPTDFKRQDIVAVESRGSLDSGRGTSPERVLRPVLEPMESESLISDHSPDEMVRMFKSMVGSVAMRPETKVEKNPLTRDSPPEVRVSIGRIDIRAVVPPSSDESLKSPRPNLSLDEYLRSRDEGER